MAVVFLPQSLRDLFPGAPRTVRVEATDVTGAIRVLDRHWPGMWDRLCGVGPDLRRHINIFVDGELAVLTTRLGPESVIRVIPALSGG